MSIVESLQMFGSNFWIYAGSFILVLSILVFVHEWGHYIVARMCGVRVESFSIGFGKEIWGYNDRNGTRWMVSLVPLGGYVKLYGDVDPASAGHTDQVKDAPDSQPRQMTEAERKVAFFAKPVWQRALVVFAGPAINYIFAILILASLYVWHGQPIDPPSAAAIKIGSAAEKYGFKPHDYILTIDGKSIEGFDDIRREMMLALDVERHFVIERDGKVIDIFAKPERTPVTDRFGFKSSIGKLGLLDPANLVDIKKIIKINDTSVTDDNKKVEMLNALMDTSFTIEIDYGTEKESLFVHPVKQFNQNIANSEDKTYFQRLFLSNQEPERVIQHTPGTALLKAIKESYNLTRGTLEALTQMILGVRSATELGGVLRIGVMAGDMAQQGVVALILFTALLSINLGFVNLLPIPLLDGGHLLFYFFEAIMGKPIPEQIQEYAFRFGLVFLIGIMAFANLNDVLQMLSKQ